MLGYRLSFPTKMTEPATLPTTAFLVAVAFGSTPRFRMLSTTFFGRHETDIINGSFHLSEPLVKFHRDWLGVPNLEAAKDLKGSHCGNLKREMLEEI